MIGARQLDEPRPLNRGRSHPGLLDGHDPVACPVEHRGRRPDQGQDDGDVGIQRLTVVVLPRAKPDREALETCQLLFEALVADAARRQELHSAVIDLGVALDDLEHFVDRLHRQVGGEGVPARQGEQHQRAAQLRMGRREQQRDIVPSFTPITAAPLDRAASSTATASATWVWRLGS
jgi:hypothetical protein